MDVLTSSPTLRYQHTPLNLSRKGQSRLLKVNPRFSGHLHYNFEIHDRTTCPDYVTLSYAWGTSETFNLSASKTTRFLFHAIYMPNWSQWPGPRESTAYVNRSNLHWSVIVGGGERPSTKGGVYLPSAFGVVDWLGIGDKESRNTIEHVSSTLFAVRDLINLNGIFKISSPFGISDFDWLFDVEYQKI